MINKFYNKRKIQICPCLWHEDVYGKREVWVHLFFTWALDGFEWSTLQLGRLNSPLPQPEKNPDTHLIEAGWPQSQDEYLGENSFALASIQTPDLLAPSPVASPARSCYHCAFLTA